MTTKHDVLTEREVEVLQCMTDHASLREVASHLHVSYSTVKWYTRQIYGKLDVNSREEAIKKAWGIGLLNVAKETPNNLPAAMTQFVGRKQELKELSSLIRDHHCRLITILATGGMGKTALALETTRQIIKIEAQPEHFTDGIYFVSLAAIDDADFVLATVASTIGFAFEHRANPKQQFLDYLRDKNMLVILDNFEQLLDATSLVIDILQTAPDISILVTSRERLNLNAETIFTLKGMRVPNTDSTNDLFQYDAVDLFMQGIRRIRHRFEPDADQIDNIRRICRLTGGMPLALILAVASFDSLSLSEIADEIEDNLDILQTDMRDIPKRLQSVRAVFESVWKRLSAKEQDIFLRMSVFRGGCTKEAAKKVAGSLPLLQALVNKALLTKSDTGRYHLHDLLRQYASERLEQLPDLYQMVHDHHCHYYSEVIAQWGWWSYDQASYTGMRSTAETDWDNVISAWLWAGQRAFNQRLWQLAYPLACVSWHRGAFQEAAWLHIDVSHALEAQKDAEIDPLLQSSLLATHAYFCNYLEQPDLVETSASKSLEYINSVDDYNDQPEMAIILKHMAMDLRHMQPVLAQEFAEQLITICRTQGKKNKLVWAYFEWAMTEVAVLGNATEAKPIIEEALELAKQEDIINLITVFNRLLARVYYQEGQLDLARKLATEALESAVEVGDSINSVTPLVLLGDVALKEGNIVEARAQYHKALIGFDSITRKPRFVLSLVAGIAELFAVEKRYAAAMNLAFFIKNHPFRYAYWSPHERAEKLLEQLTTTLPEIRFHESSNIDDVFDTLLVDLVQPA